MNTRIQYYKGVPIRLIKRKYVSKNAKRFVLNDTNQNVWIPNCYLKSDGTLKENINIDFVFHKAYRENKFRYANIHINPFEW